MPEPEDSMRRCCDALLAGDIFTAMADLTPQAMNEAMSLSVGVTQIPSAAGYIIESDEEMNGEHRFNVRFQTNQGDIHAHATWRQLNGAWKITSIGVEGLA